MAGQNQTGKRTMEKLQRIVPQLSKLLKRDFDVMKFHYDCTSLYPRLSYAMDILHTLKSSNNVQLNVSEIYVENLVKELTKIRYIPEVLPRDEFIRKFTEDIEAAYDLFAWLLTNAEKVTLRAYLTNFVDPIDVPDQFISDSDVKKASDANKELIEIFWPVYKTYAATEKDITSSQEVQSDLRAMDQEAANLKKRTDVQKDKLQNVVNSDSLMSVGKMFYETNKQRTKIEKEITLNTDVIKRMERSLSEYNKLEKQGEPNVDTLVSSLRDSLNTNRTLLNTSLKLQRDKLLQTRLILEDTVKPSISNDQLTKQVDSLKTTVQDLTNQKVALHSSVDDKLGTFRKQATGVANRKEVLSEKVNDTRNKHMELTDQLKIKETQLFNTVGGEIYHGEKLKRFIAELRGKSIVYKKKRERLQYWAAEITLLNRTADVLRSIDSSLKDVSDIAKDDIQQPNSLTTNTIEEAKQISKKLILEIETVRAVTSQAQSELLTIRREISEVLDKHELRKNNFAEATKNVTNRIDNLKEQTQVKRDQIEILEHQWKDTTRELEKLDQVFSQLVDDVLESGGDATKQTYRGQLEEKKGALQKNIEDLEQMLEDCDIRKKEILQRIKVYKNLQLIVTAKLGSG